jgi:hypothetical protein
VGKTLSLLSVLILVPSTTSSSTSRHPEAPTPESLSKEPKKDLMNFD